MWPHKLTQIPGFVLEMLGEAVTSRGLSTAGRSVCQPSPQDPFPGIREHQMRRPEFAIERSELLVRDVVADQDFGGQFRLFRSGIVGHHVDQGITCNGVFLVLIGQQQEPARIGRFQTGHALACGRAPFRFWPSCGFLHFAPLQRVLGEECESNPPSPLARSLSAILGKGIGPELTSFHGSPVRRSRTTPLALIRPTLGLSSVVPASVSVGKGQVAEREDGRGNSGRGIGSQIQDPQIVLLGRPHLRSDKSGLHVVRGVPDAVGLRPLAGLLAPESSFCLSGYRRIDQRTGRLSQDLSQMISIQPGFLA